ncbi:MAG: WG repeat-containing protein [Candidatus Cryptobacteroides sp.]
MDTSIKSVLNAIWKVGLGLLGAGVAVFSIVLVIAFYKVHYGRNEWCDRTLSANVVVRAYENSTVRIWNKSTGKYTTRKLRWVSGAPERDSLTVFCDKKGKRGYVNVNTGEIVIPAQYSKAWHFSEGLGAVLGDNGNVGFINSGNQLVIGFEIPYDKSFDYVFKDGFCVVKFWDSDRYRYSAYAADGRQVLAWCYTHIDDPAINGYRVVANEDGSWLFDKNFNEVLPDTYDRLEIAEGKDGVYATKDHIKQLLAFDGTVIEPFVIDDTRRLEYQVMNEEGDDFASILDNDVMVYSVSGWEGLMDARTGKIITPACYWSISLASPDLVTARLGYSDESVILDKKGRICCF